jgi:hypothetical protein
MRAQRAIDPPSLDVVNSLAAIADIRREFSRDLAAWSGQMDNATRCAWEAVLFQIDKLLKVWSVQRILDRSSAVVRIDWSEIDKNDFVNGLPAAVKLLHETRYAAIQIGSTLAFAACHSRQDGDKDLLETSNRIITPPA